jgi:hypothetical protein
MKEQGIIPFLIIFPAPGRNKPGAMSMLIEYIADR